MNTNVRNPKLAFVCTILVGIATGLPVTAQADEPVRVPRMDGSIVVNYSDIDLADPGGVRKLYERLEKAARDVCGNRLSPRKLSSSVAYKDCYNRALNKAVNRVNSRQLFALHAERGRKTTVG